MKNKPKGHRLRTGRVSEPNRIYLITTVTHQRQPIFHDINLGRLLVHTLRSKQMNASTLTYVIMPDHLHWLMKLNSTISLRKTVANIKSIRAHRINQQLNQYKPLWQAGFHDHALRKEEDIRTIAIYVIANPIRAGLVDHIGAYPLWDTAWL